ncbi:hypothetical protein BD770DRAFT_162004 [Pilaira anomala]|nr:hypothetical protein BD770DRAFT_162004 [Pilaira anomala]
MNVKSVNDLEHLHETNDIMFINEVETDGYTCSFSFVRGKNPRPSFNENGLLDINYFDQNGIDNLFRPFTVDPGRGHAFTGYYGNNKVRRLSTKEFYSYGGTLSRSKTQDRLKIESEIKAIESGIPCENQYQ